MAGISPAGAERLHGFGPSTLIDVEVDFGATVDRVAGDFDGDGLTDLARIHKRTHLGLADGAVTVWRNTDGEFGTPANWHGSFVTGSEIVLTGDVNGDRLDDLIAFTRGSSADVFVALSNGSGFGAKTKWHDAFCFNTELPLVGDVTGDGRDDIVTLTRDTSATVFVATSNGSAFTGNGWLWHSDFCPGEAVPKIGDVDGDGREDLIAFYRDSQPGAARGDVYVVTATNSNSFGAARKWHDWFAIGNEVPMVADVDADGRSDVLTFTRGSSNDLYVALSDGASFAGTGDKWHDDLCGGGQLPLAGAFNRDGNDDVVCVPDGGTGMTHLSLAGGHSRPWAATEEAFGFGTMGVAKGWLPPLAARPPQLSIPVLAVLVEVPGSPTFASQGRAAAFWEQWVFGLGDPSLVNYFLEMSGGKLGYTRAGLIGPLQLDPTTAPNGDIRQFIKQKIRDSGFDFRPFDRNGDGEITNQELIILQIDNASNNGGQTISPVETVDHDGSPLVIRSSVAMAGFLGRFDLVAHELAHTLGTIDFYSSGCYASGLTLMHCNANPGNVVAVHLDSYHKMRLGWARPDAYDVRYPGGALVANAQRSGWTPTQPAAILYDGRRGTHEYYLAEFRSNSWNSGRGVLPSGPAAGYDSSAVGTGVALWYFNTQEEGDPHAPVARFAAIRFGANRTLETSPWPGSDDTVYTGPGLWFTSARTNTTFIDPGPDGILDSHPPYVVLPGPNGTIDTLIAPGSDDVSGAGQISRGPDNILQSLPPRGSDDTLSLDDRYTQDFMAFTSITPANYLSRRNTKLYGKSDGAVSPQWFDNGPIGADVRVDEYGTTSPSAFVQWGLPFVPWLTNAQSGSLRAGSAFILEGTIGVLDSEGPVPVFIGNDGTSHDLPVLSWTGTRATLRIPLSVPHGGGRIICYHDNSRSIESNSLPVQVDNAFLLWVTEELSDLLGPNAPSEALGPWFDFDEDDIPNFGEFLIGTSAGIPNQAPPVEFQIVPGQALELKWSHLGSRASYGEAVPQFSLDLEHWEDMPADNEWKEGDTVHQSASHPLGTRGFVRRIFRTPGLDN